MRIQHNIPAMNAYRNYNNNTGKLSKNLEKLSSGYKINRAGDDAAGLAISEKMRAQITGLNAAQKNVKDGISLVKTAEGAMQEIHDMLNRMDYLATQSANGTYDDPVDRLNLQKEVDALKTEINRIADSANFNGIKLLDGSLDVKGELSITTEAPKAEDHAGVDGITVDTPEQGGGTKGSFTINIDELFGDNDTLEINFGKGAGFVASGDDKSAGADNTTVLNGHKMVLSFDVEDEELTTSVTNTTTPGAAKFTGKTKEEQAASIANVLKQDSNISAQFDIEAKGGKVILTNKNEGNDQATVDKVEAKDVGGAGAATEKAGLAAATETDANDTTVNDKTKYEFDGLFESSGGWEFEKGDVLTFEITDANDNKWTAKLELTEDLIGKDDKETHDKIIAKLGQTDDKKAVYFEPNDKTVAAEEDIKFSDIFTVADATSTTNSVANGSLTLEAKDAGIFGAGRATDIKLSTTNKKVTTPATATVLTDGDGGNAHSIAYKLKAMGTGTGDNNYSVGDVLTIKGKLSDGRDFEVKMEAGKDFDIGADEEATATNIAKALADVKSDKKVTITKTTTNADGTTSKETSEALVSDIFSEADDKKEIKVEWDGTDGLKFTSQVEGENNNGYVSEMTLDAAKGGALSTDLRNGVQKTAASSSVSFDALEEGATVKVGDKTYQFVTDAAKAEAGNTAVVVDDLTNGESIAKALAAQLTKDAGDTDPAYKVEQEGNKVTVTTTAKGSDVAAIAIESGTPTHKDVAFELQPNKLKAGSTITVNGKTFEFIDTAKDKNAKAADGNIAIDVDMVKGDKGAINQAMVDALAKEGFEARLEDGKVKICNDGEEEIKVSFNNGKALTLQIGDTSDSFNQMAVSVGDMHTWAMKVDGIDISTQEGAQGAIDYIKDAINYVSGVRGDLGAIQNRLEHTQNNLSVMAENIQDAESTIRDTDVAEEMMSYVKNNILVQSAQAMLAQANQLPQGVLQLLG